MTEQTKRRTLIAVAVVGGGVVLVFFLRGTSATAPAGASSAGRMGENFTPNPQNANIEEAILGARESALNTYDQSAVAEKSALEQYLLGLNQDVTARAIAFNTNQTQLRETGLTTATEQSIAETQAQAQEQAAAQQAAAQQSAQTGNWFSNIFSTLLGGAMGGLGFNWAGPAGQNPYLEPVSFGTGTVDYPDIYAPPAGSEYNPNVFVPQTG